MKLLYIDCFSGISGDMTIGALLDAGGDFAHLQRELEKLNITDEYELELTEVMKNGIRATKFDVLLQHHQEKVGVDSGRVPSLDKEEYAHDGHRSYLDIVNLITASELNENVKEMALQLFKKIAEAEGKIHGKPIDEVHFHEVGAVDSIIDIVGTAILIDELAIDKIYSAPVPTGSGTVRIEHGIYPVPAPATLEILKGIPLSTSNIRTELTTPTGAAFAAVLVEEFMNFPAMQVEVIGYGAGTKTFPDQPNVLRVVIGQL